MPTSMQFLSESHRDGHAMRAGAANQQRPVPAFLIVGSARSGTTLVQRLACELPDVDMPPETHFFDLFVRGLLRRGSPPYDADRIEAEVREWSSMEEVRGVHVDPAAVVDALDGRCESVMDLFSAIVAQLVHQHSVAGEKTPNHLFWWQPIVAAQPELRVIATVRDPRSVVASTLAAPWFATMFHARWGDDAYVALAERWRVEQELVMTMAKALGPRCLVLRYEDTVVDPPAARAAMAELLDIRELAPTHAQALERHESIVLPWETWKSGVLDDVHTHRVASWRNDLGGRRSRIVSAVCDSAMRLFGYGAGPSERLAAATTLSTLSPVTQRRRQLYRKGLRKDIEWINGVAL